MSDSSPVHILFAITAFLILFSLISVIVAPSFGVTVPTPPAFPTLQGVSTDTVQNNVYSTSNTTTNQIVNMTNGWADSAGRLIVDGTGHVIAIESGYVINEPAYGAEKSWVNDTGAYPLFIVNSSGQAASSTTSSSWWSGLSLVWNYLVFGAEIIGYLISFAGYMMLTVGVFFTLLSHFSIYIAATVGTLVTIVFFGSIVMFIRGSGGNSK